MSLSIQRNVNSSNELTLVLEGRLDTSTAPQLEAEVKNLDGVTCLHMDFEKLDYLSSAGLRVLLMAQKKMNLCGSDPKSLYLLDQELAARTYAAPSLVL